MIEPRIHSHIDPMLPDDHWLFGMWPPMDPPELLCCNRCGVQIYDKRIGTLVTWVETGAVVPSGSPDESADPSVFCMHCAGSMDNFYPLINENYALNDDGTPL